LLKVDPTAERHTGEGYPKPEFAGAAGLCDQFGNVPVRDYDVLIEEPSGATPRHGMIDELNATDAPDRLLNALAMRLKLLYDGGELRCDIRIILNQQGGAAKSPNTDLQGKLGRIRLHGRFQSSAARHALTLRS